MKIIFFVIAVFCMLYVGFADMAYAVYGDKPCSVNVNAMQNILPVTYDSNARSNPDGSVYPGDAIHFIFKYSGSATCASFLVEPLVGSDDLVFRSALLISSDNPKPHNIIFYKWVPKYLTTTHYYVDKIYHNKCDYGRCTNLVEAEHPSYSLREDKAASGQLKRLLDGSRTASTYSLRTDQTQSWHLTEEKQSYNIGVDEHILEDSNSVNQFINLVKSNCTNLSENNGCVFGHIEVNTDIDDSDQMCLFEELDKLGIDYDESEETDQCIPLDSKNKISIDVRGTGISCYSDGKCKSYTKTDSSSVTPKILHPYGDIFFKYLQIYDSDGFSFKNNDGTYYLDDVIGIHSIPDAQFKKERSGTLTFENSIPHNTIKIISGESCDDSLCDVRLSGDRISPSTHYSNNGDMISTHYSKDDLGLASIHHESEMYNLDRYIGLYQSVATPLVVCYDPVISDVKFWSYLADASNTSFENRYAAAIKYDGSVGGCIDDPDGLYKDRRVKITDWYNAFVQSDNFGVIINVTHPDLFLSDVTSIADMRILDSVRDMISNHTVADSYIGPTLAMNHTVQDVQIDSAGFARLLFDVSLKEDYLEKNFVNVTAFNTFGSTDFGGVDVSYLVYGVYEYPWGFFSTPFNVTAYKYVIQDIPCKKEFCDSENIQSIALADTDVTINRIKFTDSNDTSISLVDFYLNYHQDEREFAYMHLSDLYDMNVPQNMGSYTGEFLLNKTSIYYDDSMQNYLFENYLYGNDISFDDPAHYIINQSPRVFPEGLYSVDVEISAIRDGKQKTNTIPFDDLYLKYPLDYSVNMHPENYLDIKRATTAVSIPHYLHFGEITSVTIDDAPAKNISCNEGCLVILPNDSAIDIVAQNEWGGQIVNHNLTSVELVPYDESIWIELLPLRLFWIFFTLVILYISYRALKMIIGRRK